MRIQNTKYKIVYRMDYAIQLQKMGHKVAMTMPNLKDNRYIVFAFERDQTLEADLDALIREGKGCSDG